MIFSLLLCASVFISSNQSIEPWNAHDMKILTRARFVCSNDGRYTDTPCVKSFVKTEVRAYRVVCGRGFYKEEK